jgi:hypothetical protein
LILLTKTRIDDSNGAKLGTRLTMNGFFKFFFELWQVANLWLRRLWVMNFERDDDAKQFVLSSSSVLVTYIDEKNDIK